MNKAQLYKPDPDFRAEARTHQSNYREQILQIDFDNNDPLAKFGNLLPYWAAKEGYAFYEGYRAEILNALKSRYGNKYNKALYANLLRSEHIPLNIFIPMRFNLEAAKCVVSQIIQKEIEKISEIKIEYAPSPAKNFLNDKTSFDTYIECSDSDGKKIGIGIEVKYTEVEYKIKRDSKEYQDIFEQKNLRYYTHTIGSKYYCEDCYDILKQDELRQIWRNHILGAAMVTNGDIDDFICIHLYPHKNRHFANDAIPKYQKLLSEKGKSTFIALTFEQLFDYLKTHYTNSKEIKWINYLIQRYIF